MQFQNKNWHVNDNTTLAISKSDMQNINDGIIEAINMAEEQDIKILYGTISITDLIQNGSVGAVDFYDGCYTGTGTVNFASVPGYTAAFSETPSIFVCPQTADPSTVHASVYNASKSSLSIVVRRKPTEYDDNNYDTGVFWIAVGR